ncbi:hypothetical protein BDB01DRAFT_796351 [Pilobolus umbonatus]|nr:hypothetical protein BDB01DRAFT_796351 [Pilobolus umbonatus]
MRVPPPQSRFTSDGSTTSLSFVSIYEDEDLSNKLVADKAPRILHPSAVLFTFLQSDFAKQSDLFKLISDKIGPIDGVEIITKPGRTNLKHEIYVQVNFIRLSDSEIAVTGGLTFKDIQLRLSLPQMEHPFN